MLFEKRNSENEVAHKSYFGQMQLLVTGIIKYA
jgi:hypothetical protein